MKLRLTHLGLLLALSTVLTGIGGVAATYLVAKHEFRDLLDDDLETQSRLLSEMLESGMHDLPPDELQSLLATVFEEDDEDTLWVNVYERSTGLLTSNLSHSKPMPKVDDETLSLALDGYDWHGSQRASDRYVVQILRRDDYLSDAQEDVFDDIATPVLVAGGINLALLAIFLTMVLRPVTRLSRQLETRSPDSLAPLSVSTSTREVAVLRDTLNRLINNVDDVLSRERQFANDVAHELRTPLTTLKLELAGDDPDIAVLKFEVNRLTQLVSQMLTLARVEQGHLRRSFADVDLELLCTQELEQLSPDMMDAGMTVSRSLSSLAVPGDKVLLAVLLRNLLLNVLRHAGPGTELDVRLERTDLGVCLSVEDNGPGIEPAHREALNAGYSRMDSRSAGHGLGLAICRKIAAVHGASLTLEAREDGGNGLLARVVFPA